jgi:hypothetical protein
MTDAFDLSERREQRRRTKADERERARKRILGFLMSTSDGRQFLWDELDFCGCNSMSYVPGRPFDEVAFREGSRNVGQRLMAQLQTWFPNEYVQMMRENASAKIAKEEAQDE